MQAPFTYHNSGEPVHLFWEKRKAGVLLNHWFITSWPPRCAALALGLGLEAGALVALGPSPVLNGTPSPGPCLCSLSWSSCQAMGIFFPMVFTRLRTTDLRDCFEQSGNIDVTEILTDLGSGKFS